MPRKGTLNQPQAEPVCHKYRLGHQGQRQVQSAQRLTAQVDSTAVRSLQARRLQNQAERQWCQRIDDLLTKQPDVTERALNRSAFLARVTSIRAG